MSRTLIFIKTEPPENGRRWAMRQDAVTGMSRSTSVSPICALRILISAFPPERAQQSGDLHPGRGPGGLPLQLSP